MPNAHESEHKAASSPPHPSAALEPKLAADSPPRVTQFSLPTGLNCSPIFRDPKGGRGPSVYAIKVMGTLPTATAVVLGGFINLCYVPKNAYLSDFRIAGAGVTGTLQDNLPTPTVYCATVGAAPVTTMAAMSATEAQRIGTMYGSAPRAIGVTGPAIVQWQPLTLLQILAAANVSTVGALNFMLEWSPIYDG